MKKQKKCALLLGAMSMIAMAGCASNPAADPAPAEKVATAAPAPAPAPAATVTTNATDADAPLKVDTRGYRKVTRDGTDYYCKKERTTGSRVQTKESCQTREQLAASQAASDEFMRRVQNMNNDMRTGDDRQYNNVMTQ